MFRTIYSGISGSYFIFSCPATDKQNHTCNDIMLLIGTFLKLVKQIPWHWLLTLLMCSNNIQGKADIYHVVCLGWAVLYSLADAPAGSSFKLGYISVFIYINNLLASVTERCVAYGKTKKKKNHQDCRRKHRFWIKSSGWSLSTSSFDHPTWPAGLSQGGESQENAVSAWCKSCSWLMSCLSKMKWMKWDSGWPDNVKAETVLPASLLRHPGSIWWTRRVHNIMSRQSPEL